MDSKIKILCLHGYRQNMKSFSQKLGSLRKLLKAHAELTFVEAPHVVNTTTSDNENQEERSWWFTDTNSYVSKLPSEKCIGFDDSMKYLQNIVSQKGPFDGLLGFSQGATLAAIICSMCETGDFLGCFKFAIIVAGFKSLCKPHEVFYERTINIPSLHIIGDTDNVISKERSENLKELFINSEVVNHPGGHYVPASKEYKEIYINYLLKYKDS